MGLGSAKHVELKGMRRDPDEVESGELEEVELPLKEAKQSLWVNGLLKFGRLPDLVSYM